MTRNDIIVLVAAFGIVLSAYGFALWSGGRVLDFLMPVLYP